MSHPSILQHGLGERGAFILSFKMVVTRGGQASRDPQLTAQVQSLHIPTCPRLNDQRWVLSGQKSVVIQLGPWEPVPELCRMGQSPLSKRWQNTGKHMHLHSLQEISNLAEHMANGASL